MQLACEPRALLFVRVDQAPAQLARRFFRLPAPGDVDGHAVQAEGFAVAVELAPPAHGEPARTQARHHPANVVFKVTTRKRSLHRSSMCLAVIGVHPLHALLEGDRPRGPRIRRVLAQLGGPHLIGWNFPHPETHVCGIGGEAHALLACAQRFLRLPALGDVDGHAAHAERFAVVVEFAPPTHSDPARLQARHRQAIVGFKVTMTLKRPLHRSSHRLAVIGVHSLHGLLKVAWLRSLPIQHVPAALRRPHLIGWNSPTPRNAVPRHRRRGSCAVGLRSASSVCRRLVLSMDTPRRRRGLPSRSNSQRPRCTIQRGRKPGHARRHSAL